MTTDLEIFGFRLLLFLRQEFKARSYVQGQDSLNSDILGSMRENSVR